MPDSLSRTRLAPCYFSQQWDSRGQPDPGVISRGRAHIERYARHSFASIVRNNASLSMGRRGSLWSVERFQSASSPIRVSCCGSHLQPLLLPRARSALGTAQRRDGCIIDSSPCPKNQDFACIEGPCACLGASHVRAFRETSECAAGGALPQTAARYRRPATRPAEIPPG
jgi:hypothetical protein